MRWPLSSNDYQLETKFVLDPAVSWSPVLAAPVLVGSNYFVTNQILEARQFYRLHGQPTRILLHPVGETNGSGATIELNVVVEGSPPFSYQWRLNGVSLLSKTNSSLVISNLQLVNCGSYEVVVANNVAAKLSQPALVKLFGTEVVFSDDFGSFPASSDENGSLNGSNVGATKQAGEPAHASKAGGRSVWFSWTPTQSGIATFDTIGSSFDTLLAVYTGTNVATLTNLVSDEDGAEFYRSTVKFNAVGGTKYEIAIDGFAGSSGNLVLNWSEEITSDTVPIILSQPRSQSVLPNTSATFSVVAESQPSLTNFYQWQFNGLAITNATGTNYTIPSVNRTNLNLGDYSVVVSNSFGRSVKSAVAALQTATAQAGFSTNAFLLDKLEEPFDDSGTNGGQLRGSIKDPKHPDIEPNFVSVTVGTLTIVSGTDGLTQGGEPPTCVKVVTGTLYVDLIVAPSSIAQTMTVNTRGSTANTALRLRLPNGSTVCNDNLGTSSAVADWQQSERTTTIPIHTSAFKYTVTIGTVQNSPVGAIQLNVILKN